MEVPPPLDLKRTLYVPNKTLMGPGPSNCSQRVLESMSNPVLGHLHPECLQIMDEIKAGLKYVFQTLNDATMCVSGSGHAGMETALCNLIEDGDMVLLGTTGIWGQRAAEMAKRYGAEVRFVEARLGRSLTMDEIIVAFAAKPKVFFVAQGDSSTGILQSHLREIAVLCRKHDCLFVVDTVASLGGTEFLMDDWLIDVAYTGSQKVLGAPPGITPISFNERAIEHIRARKNKSKVYYFDALLIGQYWNCFGTPRIYHHTISSTLLYGLREALAQIFAQGLKSVIRRHQECSYRLQSGMEEIGGLEMFVPNAKDRLPTVNTIKVPAGVDWRKVSEYAMRKYNLEISGGLGPTAEHVFRIGLMGENATIEKVDLVLNILHEAIQSTKLKINAANEKSKI